ncbi:MAG: citrate lyase subunit gamma [Methanomicrobia archaeon]|nr:citrate lyase subunit gamma [Methanomicrobia archaeon]
MIKKTGESGNPNSKNDAYVKIEPSEKSIIKIESSLFDLFGEKMAEEVKEVLNEYNVKKASVTVIDRNALDFVLQARVEDALRKAMGEKDEV